MLDGRCLMRVEALNATLAENVAKPVVDAGDLATELRLTGGKTPHRRHPRVRRIRTFNCTAGQAVEHQGERRIAAFRAYASRHMVNLLCGEHRLLWFRRHDGRS